MPTQGEKANIFRSLHVKGSPVVLFNVWDAGSAKIVSKAGARAIATGSAPVAMANDFGDGQDLPLELALGNIGRIANAVDLPVTMDIEGAYSENPEMGAANMAKAIEAGAVGFNFEDQIVGGSGLHAADVQSNRIRAARKACDSTGIGAFINARTDVFLKALKQKLDPTAEMLDEAVMRAEAYMNAGADGFFAPGLHDIEMIAELCGKTELPVNMLALPDAPSHSELARAGVARISYGPVGYLRMSDWLQKHAEAVLADR